MTSVYVAVIHIKLRYCRNHRRNSTWKDSNSLGQLIGPISTKFPTVPYSHWWPSQHHTRIYQAHYKSISCTPVSSHTSTAVMETSFHWHYCHPWCTWLPTDSSTLPVQPTDTYYTQWTEMYYPSLQTIVGLKLHWGNNHRFIGQLPQMSTCPMLNIL